MIRKSGHRFFERDHAPDLTIRGIRDGPYRYLHQASGSVGRGQPADPADWFPRRDQPADSPVSETVEYGGQRHYLVSRRIRGADPGIHHDADRAGGRLGRRRRLHHLFVGAGHQHDPGLYQAELRPEPGADRSAGQGQLGQISDPEGIQRSGRHQDHRPDHGCHVSRLLQRGAVGVGDFGLPHARGAARAFHGRRRGFGRYSGRADLCDAAVARSGEDGRARHLVQ